MEVNCGFWDTAPPPPQPLTQAAFIQDRSIDRSIFQILKEREYQRRWWSRYYCKRPIISATQLRTICLQLKRNACKPCYNTTKTSLCSTVFQCFSTTTRRRRTQHEQAKCNDKKVACNYCIGFLAVMWWWWYDSPTSVIAPICGALLHKVDHRPKVDSGGGGAAAAVGHVVKQAGRQWATVVNYILDI